MTKKTKKSLKIALFCLIAIFALSFACSATEYSFSLIDDEPDDTFEHDIMCNYDGISIPFSGSYFNLQLVQLADLGFSNMFVYCSNIELYCTFVDSIPQGSDTEQFSELIYDKLVQYNIEAEYINDDWYTQSVLAELYISGTEFLAIPENNYRYGFDAGYDDGFSDGFNDGKASGYNDGLTDSNALGNGIKTIFSAPVYILGGILDFELLGFSFYDFIVSIISIFLIGYIVKIFVGFV